MKNSCHEHGKGRVPQDGVVREADVGDVEVDELGVVVVALAESDREAHLPKGGGRAIHHPREQPGVHELVIGHWKPLESLDREHIETSTTINESLGDGDIANGGCVEHGERAGGGRTLEVVLGVKGNGILRLPEGTCGLKLREGRIHLTRELLEDAV